MISSSLFMLDAIQVHKVTSHYNWYSAAKVYPICVKSTRKMPPFSTMRYGRFMAISSCPAVGAGRVATQSYCAMH
jgi:hypothetical protein